MCKISKEIIDVYKIDLKLDSYTSKQKEYIISESFKETFTEKDAKLLLNNKELEEIKEKGKMIEEKIKWLFYEKKIVVDFKVYLLRMSIRLEDNKSYIHSINALSC